MRALRNLNHFPCIKFIGKTYRKASGMNETPSNNPWLRSAFWDGFWMLSGIWLLGILAFFSSMPDLLKTVLIIFTLALWLSHRFATTFNAFCTPAYRPLLVEQRVRF